MNDDTLKTQIAEPQWGRREADRKGTPSTEKIDQADRVIRFAVLGLLALVAAVAVGALWLTWHTGQRMEQLINDTQLSAQRNTELLAVECNLETGKPYPLPSEEPFVNTDEFLVAFCGRQVRQANVISGYLETINTAAKEQLTVHEENTKAEHQRLEALIQQRRAAPVERKPIPTRNRHVAPTPKVSGIPAPAPTPTPTTTCATNKQGHCIDKNKEKKK